LGLGPQNEPKRTGHLRRVVTWMNNLRCFSQTVAVVLGQVRTGDAELIVRVDSSGKPAIINECKTRYNEGTFLTAGGDRMVPRKILQRTANLLRTRCVYRRDGPARASSFSMPTPADAHPNARWGQGNRRDCGGPCQTECLAPLAPHAVVPNGRQGVDFDPPPPRSLIPRLHFGLFFGDGRPSLYSRNHSDFLLLRVESHGFSTYKQLIGHKEVRSGGMRDQDNTIAIHLCSSVRVPSLHW